MASRVLFVFLAVLGSSCGLAAPPSDSKVVSELLAHRQEIEVLVQMIRADKVLLRVDSDWTMPANPTAVGVAAQRIEEYRRLLRKVGYPRGFYYRPETGEIEFVAWASGTVASGGSKSVVYSPQRLGPIVADTSDPVPSRPDGSRLAYREIASNWYIQFQEN